MVVHQKYLDDCLCDIFQRNKVCALASNFVILGFKWNKANKLITNKYNNDNVVCNDAHQHIDVADSDVRLVVNENPLQSLHKRIT